MGQEVLGYRVTVAVADRPWQEIQLLDTNMYKYERF